MFSQVPLLVLNSLLTILLPSSSSTLHSVPGVATFSDGPALPLLLRYTGNLASVMPFTLPLGALSRFSGACALLIIPHLALRSLPVCSGSPRLRWAPGQTGARLLSTPTPSRSLPTWVSPLALRPRHSTVGFPVKLITVFTVPFVTDSLPWCLTCMASLLTSPLTTSSLSFRTPCTRLTCLLLPFVFGVLPAGAMTTLPQAVPLVIGRVPPPAPSVMILTAPSCIIFPFALLTATPGPLGLILVASPCLMPLCCLCTAGSSTLSMKPTHRKRSGPTSFSLAMSVTNSNLHLGEMHAPRSSSRSSHLCRPRLESSSFAGVRRIIRQCTIGLEHCSLGRTWGSVGSVELCFLGIVSVLERRNMACLLSGLDGACTCWIFFSGRGCSVARRVTFRETFPHHASLPPLSLRTSFAFYFAQLRSIRLGVAVLWQPWVVCRAAEL